MRKLENFVKARILKQEMDVRIKYPFKHFLKEGIHTKPVKKKVCDGKDLSTDIHDVLKETNSSNDSALVITSDNHRQSKYPKQIRVARRNPLLSKHPDSNKQSVEQQCYGIQPGLPQSEITSELIRYAHMINTIQKINPQLFLRRNLH
ncbi:unnamed protein product [Heterobilharzia americana]|nr:unnamed protein product [Heterobilharzia americana]